MKKKEYLYLLITFILWGSMYVVSKLVLGKIPTFALAFFRYLLAYIMLRFLSHNKNREIDPEDYKEIFIIGFIGYFLAVGMQLIGTKLAGSSLASLINSLNPIFISLMAIVVLKEKMTKPKIIGIILSIIGVYFIVGSNMQGNILGIILSLFAVIGWAFMSVTSRKISKKYDASVITTYAMMIAMIFNIPMAIGEILVMKPVIQVDLTVVLSILYIGIICTALTNLLWNKCLSKLEANVCSAFYPIQTLTSSALGIIVFHETMTVSFIAGSTLIIFGVLISLLIKMD